MFLHYYLNTTKRFYLVVVRKRLSLSHESAVQVVLVQGSFRLFICSFFTTNFVVLLPSQLDMDKAGPLHIE